MGEPRTLVGHRIVGRRQGRRNSGQRGIGYSFLHHAVDDHSRLAHSESLSDEKKETAAGFWLRANRFFAAAGIPVTALHCGDGTSAQAAADQFTFDPVPTPRLGATGTDIRTPLSIAAPLLLAGLIAIGYTLTGRRRRDAR